MDKSVIQDFVISFPVTEDQAAKVCEHYGKNINDLQEYEICELLDKGPNSYLKDIYNDLEYKIFDEL